MSGSYTRKALQVKITLGQGQFGDSGYNTVTLSGLRIVANVIKGGFPALDTATIRIYGVDPSIMNAVSTMGVALPLYRVNNTVTLLAGDYGGAMSVVYTGYMGYCWQDFSEAPETSLVITGIFNGWQMVKSVAPTSIPGTADVATIMSGLAVQMGMKFENNGVSQTISNQYLRGSYGEQAQELARAANINMCFDSSIINGALEGAPGGTLAIWPRLGTRQKIVPLINAANGMIGYPQYQSSGMSFRCLFNPNIILGGQIQMQSILGGSITSTGSLNSNATSGGPNGFWYVVSPLVHDLSCEMPGGPWFTSASCVRVPGQVA